MIRGFQLVRDTIRWAIEQDIPVAIAANLSDRIVRNGVQYLLDGVDSAAVKKADKGHQVEDIYDWYMREYRVLLLPIEQVGVLDNFHFGNYLLCTLREKRLTYRRGDESEFCEDVIYPTIEIR